MTTSAAPYAVPVVVAATTPLTFDAFFAEQWGDVAGYCASLVGDYALGEELAQEAFARVYARFPVLREPRPYCFRVALNLARGHLRRSAREVSSAEVEVVARSVGVDPHLLDAVQRLAPRLREVVLLHYFADLALAEVAAVLRRPQGTVGRQLHEARSALAESLGDRHG